MPSMPHRLVSVPRPSLRWPAHLIVTIFILELEFMLDFRWNLNRNMVTPVLYM